MRESLRSFVMVWTLFFEMGTVLLMGEIDNPTQELPPLVPSQETIIGSDQSFQEECLVVLRKLPSSRDWEFVNSVLAVTQEWGEVWRIDFKLRNFDSGPLVNRLIFWRSAEAHLISVQIAYGQNIESL